MKTITTSNGIKFLVSDAAEKDAANLIRSIGYADKLRENRDKKHEARKMGVWMKMRESYERQLAAAETQKKQAEEEAKKNNPFYVAETAKLEGEAASLQPSEEEPPLSEEEALEPLPLENDETA